MTKQNTIGIIGLGRMGGPIARRLMQFEYPLMVWDILPACREPFENKGNIRIVPPREMAANAASFSSLSRPPPRLPTVWREKTGSLGMPGRV